MRFHTAVLGLVVLAGSVATGEAASLKHRLHHKSRDPDTETGGGVNISATEEIAELTDGDPDDSPEDEKKEEDPTKTFGYVKEYGSAIKVMTMGIKSGGGPAFLEMGSFVNAEMVKDLPADGLVGTQLESHQAPAVPAHHAALHAAIASYEKEFQKAFPEGEPSPYRFAQDFAATTAANTAPTPYQPQYLFPARLDSQQSHITSGGFRFAQVHAKQDPGGEDEYIDPLSYITPATVAAGTFAAGPPPAGGPAAAAPGQLNDFGTGLFNGNYAGGLYAGGVVAPPPPPRPDNLPPPPWIRPPNQPLEAAAR